MTPLPRPLPKFAGRAFLAPMAGVTDPAMRLLCRRRGAGLVVTEFTSAHCIVAREGRRQRRGGAGDVVEFSEEERPVSVQLFGSDAGALERAAGIVGPHFDVIDYNMGCPAPHITRQAAGGALLQEPDLTRRILRALARGSDRPVTVKMRAGVSGDSARLFLRAARVAEEEGASMIALHPRTVSQGYSGRSDWSLIAELKRSVGVPVVGNGDIATPEDARDMLEETGCDYVMIGRGAMGNPFLFEQVNDLLERGRYRARSPAERAGAFFEYAEAARRFSIRFPRVRAQAMRFVRGLPRAARARARIAASRDAGQLERAVGEALGGAERGPPPVSRSSSRPS